MTTEHSESDAAWLRRRVVRHVSELSRLAWPVVVARCGVLVMALVDTIVVGRYGTDDLAIISLASGTFAVLLISGIGLMNGTAVLVSHAVGREEWATCGAVFRAALPYGLAIGVAGFAICFLGGPLFRAIGQPELLADEGGRLMVILGLGLPGVFLWTVAGMTLQALKRPMPEMIAMVAANVANVFLDVALVFGRFGFPELGAEGAAWASTILRWALGLGLVAYVLLLRDRERLTIRRGPALGRTKRRDMRRIGYGAAGAMAIESAAFATMGLFAGLAGVVALAAFSIALNLLALVFMIALGLGIASAVRVGIAYGRRDWPDLALAGWTGLASCVVTMGVLGAVVLAMPVTIASIYTSDPELIALFLGLFTYIAVVCVFDGSQVVMINANRARADVAVPTVIHVIAYGVIMIPLGWVLCLTLDRGAQGLFEAIAVASVIASVAQSLRFWALQRRDRRRAARRAARA